MKKIPSMASMDPKNKACDNGELPIAFDKWLRFAPSESHWKVNGLADLVTLAQSVTYCNQENGQSCNHCSGEKDGNYFWRTCRIRPEDVVYLWHFSIS